MTDVSITTSAGRVTIGCDDDRARLELPTEPPAALRLGAGELLMTIEALVMCYAELRGARPDSAARGVMRTLHNRTRGPSAREGRHSG
jgi:hypothetical protein